MKKIYSKRIWIAWETQRRTVELARHFKSKLIIIDYKGITRFPFSILKTIKVLICEKPETLFVQNPSMILAWLGAIYKILYRKYLVVDRHSNFLINKNYKSLTYKIFYKILHKYTLRNSDFTIVTNRFLADLVIRDGGKAFILQDKLPCLKKTFNIKMNGKYNILFIASHQKDEPLNDVIGAISYIRDNNFHLYISGNIKGVGKKQLKVPKNIFFTGFLPETEFINLIYSVDIVMVLTNIEHCLLCGCYEAVAAEKPLLTSNTKTLKEYFTNAVFVQNNYKDIAIGLNSMIDDLNKHKMNIRLLKAQIERRWEKKARLLEKMLRKNE